MRREFGSKGRDFDSDRPRGNGGGFKKDFGNKNWSSGPREMHKAVCADCNAECEVPFKPAEGKPVYCRACYANHRPQRF